MPLIPYLFLTLSLVVDAPTKTCLDLIPQLAGIGHTSAGLAANTAAAVGTKEKGSKVDLYLNRLTLEPFLPFVLLF